MAHTATAKITVEKIMTRDVATLDPNMTLVEMDSVLVGLDISGAPVVADGRLVGIVSRGDVLRAIYDEQVEAQRLSGFYDSPFPISIPSLEHMARDSRRIADHMIKRRVYEVMSHDPLTVGPDEDVISVAKLMSTSGIHRVPVTRDGQLVGIVSSLDIVRVVAESGYPWSHA